MHIHLSPSQINSSLSHYHHISTAQDNAFKHFREVFPSTLDFSRLVSELKTDFEGVWAGSHLHAHELRVAHPVFTCKGDLLLELLPRGEQTKAIVGRKKQGMPGAKPIQMNGGANGTMTKEKGSWFRNGKFPPSIIPPSRQMTDFYLSLQRCTQPEMQSPMQSDRPTSTRRPSLCLALCLAHRRPPSAAQAATSLRAAPRASTQSNRRRASQPSRVKPMAMHTSRPPASTRTSLPRRSSLRSCNSTRSTLCISEEWEWWNCMTWMAKASWWWCATCCCWDCRCCCCCPHEDLYDPQPYDID